MFLRITYENEFDDLMMHLKAKYPQKLFDLDGIGEQTDMSKFSKKFFSSKVTADASIDANANVDDISVIAYNSELPKPFFKINSYYMLWKELKKLYNLEIANEIIEMQITGDIYINDAHGIGGGLSYCYNYSTYDIMTKGLPMVNKIKSIAPKYLYSFKSQLEQFTIIAANSTLGATGLADMLVIMSYYVKNIITSTSDAGFKLASTEDCWKYIKETLISFIYTINQPMRGNQCVTEDTEILTPTGFKKYNELSVGEDIYTWQDGKLNIQKVKKVNIYDYVGIMHKYTGRDGVQMVTPNHRILHKKNNTKKYILSESSKLINKKTPLTYPVAMLEDDRQDYKISDDMLKLCIFILTDGTIDMEKTGRVSIFKSPNRWGNEEIVALLNNLNLKYRYHQEDSNFGGKLNHYNINTESSQEVLKLLNYTKKILPNWFTQLSKRQANLVINLWAKLDGHTDIRYKQQKCQCDNYKIADQLQHVCFLAGKGSNITAKIIGNNKKETIYLIPYNRINKDVHMKELVQYEGKVWCPTTDDGVVVFRKDKKIFISGNSCFTNISIYDDNFLLDLQKDYIYPDGTNMDIEIVKMLQDLFLTIMNEELHRTAITFPITTACFSIDENNNIKDKEFVDFISKHNKKFGFINIFCGSTSKLSSCCRLISDKNNEYFNSFGSGSSKIGSLGVVTINLPRLAFKYKNSELFYIELKRMVNICSKINNAKRKLVQKRIDNGNHPLYSLEFIDITTQYSTVGINGFNECIEIQGLDILTQDGINQGLKIIQIINEENNKYAKQYKAPHNCEQIPAENVSIKLPLKDKLLKYQDKYTIYSNQFIPLTTNANVLDRIKLQGIFDSHFSGGAIAHINVDSPIEEEFQLKNLIEMCAKMGVVYFAINYVLSECENGHMCVTNGNICTICGENIKNKYSRVVGFLTNIHNWHQTRREEDFPNRQFYKGNEI